MVLFLKKHIQPSYRTVLINQPGNSYKIKRKNIFLHSQYERV